MVVCRLRSAEIKSTTFFPPFFNLKRKGYLDVFNAISLKMISLMWQTNAHTFKDILFERVGRKKTTTITTELTTDVCLCWGTQPLGTRQVEANQRQAGGFFRHWKQLIFWNGYCRGSLNSHFGGDQGMQKSVAILRDFLLIVHIVWVGNVMTPVLLLENSWTNSAVRDDSHTLLTNCRDVLEISCEMRSYPTLAR